MEAKQRKIDGSQTVEDRWKQIVWEGSETQIVFSLLIMCFVAWEERVEKILVFIQNPQNNLKMVLKLGSIWEFTC